jgi:hypothetical protein
MRVCLLLVLVACGGGGGSEGPDLTGVYRVDSAVASEPCGADAEIAYDAFVKFEKMEILGAPFYAYSGCADAAGTDCAPSGGLFEGFAEPIADGWRGILTSSSGGGAIDCILGYVEQTATLDGAALAIEISSHAEEVPGLSEDQCSPDEAELRNTSMECVEHTLIDATKI